MAKFDATRNYYADLELSPSASSEDIKKQFRKLALKYHPDRNPGREAEVNSQFQIIQSAHEILTDDALRKKYDDTVRASRSRYPGASGVRGNPWQDAAKHYPPPPRRANPTAAGTQSQPRAASGASRYSNFAEGVPRGGKPASQKTSTDSSKWNNYRAWESMRSQTRGKASNPPNPPPPPPGRPPTSSTREGKAAEPEGPSIPRTASQRHKAQASFGNSTRRTGYTPNSPGLGDEPPVVSKNYYTDRTHSNIFASTSASATYKARQASGTGPPDPLAQFRENYMDGRQSTPYATPGGEKTSLFDEGSGLGRAKSTRETSRKANGEDLGNSTFPFPRQRARSTSTPRSSSNDGGSEDSTRVNTGAHVTSNASSGHNSATPSRTSDRYKPRPSSSGTPGQPSSTADTPRPSTSGQEANQPASYPSMYASPSTSRCFYFQSQGGNGGSCEIPRAVHEPVQIPSVSYRTRSSSEAVMSAGSSLNTFERVLRHNVGLLTDMRGRLRALKADGGPTPRNTTGSSTSGNANSPRSSFNFQSGSTDNIDTRFVDAHDGADWEFKAGGNEAESPSRMRSRPGSGIGRSSPARPMARPRPPTRTATNSETDQPASEDGAKSGFSAGEWSEKIGSHHFVPQVPTSGSTSPSRRAPSRAPSRKNSKPVKKTVGTAGLVEDEDSSDSEGWREVPSAPSGTDSPNAMDIDPPEKADPTLLKGTHINGVRNIHVEPSRPEWRAGNVEAAAPNLPPRTTAEGQPNMAAPGPAETAPPPAVPPRPNPFAIPTGGSEDSEEFRTNFSEFKKVEPFSDPAPAGLNTFADLKSTLPFESQASAQAPVEHEQPAPVPLEFPTAPVAPRLPPTMAVAAIRPSMSQFRKYAHDFGNYMDKWEIFNQKVLDHFVARQVQHTSRRQELGPSWLDTTAGGDMARIYQAEAEQDHEVRKQWNRACDEHQNRIREFVTFRDRVK